MSQKKADLLLFTVALAWGSSNVLLKIGAENIGTLNLIGLRFGLAFITTFLIFFKRMLRVNLKTILYSALTGVILCSIFMVLIYALKLEDASRVGFLSSISVLLVPALMAVYRRERPEKCVVIGMVLVLTGLILLMNPGEMIFVSAGSFLSILAAFINAAVVIVTNAASHAVEDTLQLGVYQLGFAGLFGWIGSFIMENPRLPETSVEWTSVLLLALICSAYGFIALSYGQKYTVPEHSAFAIALEPVFSAVFAFFVLGERMEFHNYAGALLIFLSVMIAGKIIDIGKVWSI